MATGKRACREPETDRGACGPAAGAGLSLIRINQVRLSVRHGRSSFPDAGQNRRATTIGVACGRSSSPVAREMARRWPSASATLLALDAFQQNCDTKPEAASGAVVVEPRWLRLASASCSRSIRRRGGRESSRAIWLERGSASSENRRPAHGGRHGPRRHYSQGAASSSEASERVWWQAP